MPRCELILLDPFPLNTEFGSLVFEELVILIDGEAAKELWVVEYCEGSTDLGRFLHGGLRTAGGQRPQKRETLERI